MKKLLYLFPVIVMIILQGCSKGNTPKGMTCDYAPYAYKKTAIFKYRMPDQFGKIDSGTATMEVVGDSTINNVQYANILASYTSSKGVSSKTPSVVRCGGGVFQYSAVNGKYYDMKVLPENPSVGNKWSNGPYSISSFGVTMDVMQYFEVVSTTASLTVQGKTYSNLVKVKFYTSQEYQGMALSKSAYAIYYWDKTNGMVCAKVYMDENSFENEKNEYGYQELVSLI